MTTGGLRDNDVDGGVVGEICGFLTAKPPRSFFLFAGAGSGKTRTLVEVLEHLTGLVPGYAAGTEFARGLRTRGQSIRVITYTKIAAAEVTHRLGSNALARVSTIHSFAWDLIQGFDDDIRLALVERASAKLREETAKADGKKKGRTEADDLNIAKMTARIERLRLTSRFSYTPDRTNYGDGALQHADVLSALTVLLGKRGTLAQILADRHPVLLIDESQDTMVGVLDVLRDVASMPSMGLTVGLLGDHRQRVYLEGHRDLPAVIPAEWARPILRMNHRSQRRIVTLINAIWAAKVDGRTQDPTGVSQQPRVEKAGGLVRIFIGNGGTTDDKQESERQCAARMADLTGSSEWLDHERGYRLLAIEHKLAAHRGGFLRVWTALDTIDENGVRQKGDVPDGSDAGPAAIRVLMREVATLSGCISLDGSLDEFAAVEVLRRFRRLDVLDVPAEEQPVRLARVAAGVRATAAVLKGQDTTVRDVLAVVSNNDLFDVSPQLRDALESGPVDASDDDDDDDDLAKRAVAWRTFLDAPWAELMQYRKYLADALPFGTHQGVKGAEYDHVMVVLDDGAARGNQASYDKILGVKPLTDADKRNVKDGKETAIDKTLRLLYVTCSRPKESLAVVHWTSDPDAAIRGVTQLGWFAPDEIIRLGS
jgi:DNA helicase-2/ATP-dependent DNA helicase PcrA